MMLKHQVRTKRNKMSLVKHTPEQEIKMLEKQIKKIEDKDIKGFIARMARHYEVKKLRNKIKEIEKSLPTQK